MAGQGQVPHEDVLDLLRCDARTLERGGDGEAAQLGGTELCEGATHLPDRGAGAGDDV